MTCSLTFISVKGPELLAACVRKSEENFQRAFQRARDVGPSVMVFDEQKFIAPKRGGHRYERGVMGRIVLAPHRTQRANGISSSSFFSGEEVVGMVAKASS